MKIQITQAQYSAIECGGVLEVPEGRGEVILRDSLNGCGSTLTIDDGEDVTTVLETLTALANAEDDRAEDPTRDPDCRAGDRGARTALTNLSARIITEVRRREARQ